MSHSYGGTKPTLVKTRNMVSASKTTIVYWRIKRMLQFIWGVFASFDTGNGTVRKVFETGEGGGAVRLSMIIEYARKASGFGIASWEEVHLHKYLVFKLLDLPFRQKPIATTLVGVFNCQLTQC
jgi:hypothetical protein